MKKAKQKDKTAEDPEKIEELTELLQRVQADFENYKKRVEQEQKDFIVLGRVLVIKKLLPFLDSFTEAMNSNGKVIEPLYKQLQKILDDFNLKSMDVIGEKLDPYVHECIAEEESDKPKGTIIEEIQRGYLVDGFVVRHAKVKVSRGEATKEDDSVKENSKE